jgi:nucleoside 2-deoxyribosyltransferase
VKVYLASPLGFAESTRDYLQRLMAALRDNGHEVFDPWVHESGQEIEAAKGIADPAARRVALRDANFKAAEANAEGIRGADVVLAVLDGVDVDSGTASEAGYAFGLDKRVFGLRTDFRLTGDNEATTVNLQVEYWIKASGGKIFRTLAEVEAWAGDAALS